MTDFVIITGGIGSGKSVVSRILTIMGFPVYNCDSEAKRLVDTDPALRSRLIDLLGEDAYNSEGHYDTRRVAAKVFENEALLAQINAIVHPAVVDDIRRWRALTGFPAFVETALARQSGLLERNCAAVWHVVAPESVRIARVVERSGLTPEQVRQRIDAQRSALVPFPGEVTLVNDNRRALLPQVIDALRQLTQISLT